MTLSLLSIIPAVYDVLFNFAQSDGFWANLGTAFGTSYDVVKATELRQQWKSRNFSQIPPIEVLSDEVLGTANGAYSSSTNKIYLSASFLNTASSAAIVNVILEEIGHYVDDQINPVDTVGDEGELFSHLVRGVNLTEAELTYIQAEDDRAVIDLEGHFIQIEQAAPITLIVNTTIDENDGSATIGSGLSLRDAVAIANKSPNTPFGAGFTTIINNGPSSNRVDVVFLGDGYTSTDLMAGSYDSHVNTYVDYMFSNSLNSDPFYRYRNYFNIHKIDVVSNESGADVPPDNIFRDTALDASYYFDGSTERLLYIDNNKANAVRDTALAGSGFTAEMQYVTVNDTKYGGGGGSYAVYAGGNAYSQGIALHEVAHSFSNLADEYGGTPGPYPGGEPTEVNVTKEATGDKWSRWLGYNQPTIGVIGAYEGGRYYDKGIYRPSNNSKMRSLNRPFDAVGREKIILDIYDLVDPLDSWLDNSVPLVNPEQIWVKAIDNNVINLEWFVDSSLISTAIGETFNLANFGYRPGNYVVSARAFDPTAFDLTNGWVRKNQSNLEQVVSWNVTISNDDTSVTLAVSPASVTEDGTTNLIYTFTRSGLTTNSLTVNYTLGGTATLNTDYTRTGTTNTVTFAANSATATVTIDPTTDTTDRKSVV